MRGHGGLYRGLRKRSYSLSVPYFTLFNIFSYVIVLLMLSLESAELS